MRIRAMAALAVAAAFTLAGCGSNAEDPEAVPTDPGSSTEPAATEGTTEPHQGGDLMDDNVVEPTTLPVPEWDETSRDSALEVATTILGLYGQNTLDAAEWWAQLEPYTSTEAAVWFESIDPRNIPTFTVTGAGELVNEDATAWLAWVQIPTDVGAFTVMLSRDDGDSDWRLEQIELPDLS